MLKLLEKIIDKFIELHGDRIHGDTQQVRCGLGWIGKHRVVIVLHNHRSIDDLVIGYRKSLRMLRLAEQLKRPTLWCIENTEIALPTLSLNLLNNINENIKAILNLKAPIIGIFSLYASSSAIVIPNIVDHAIILADDDKTCEASIENAEILNLEDLSHLKARLINKLTEISKISSSDLISQRFTKLEKVSEDLFKDSFYSTSSNAASLRISPLPLANGV